MYFEVLNDRYNKDDIASIKQYFDSLFDNFQKQESFKYYGFIFDITVLSSYNMFKYAKDLRSFFTENKQNLHTYIGCTALIIDSTFIRIILAPLIKLVNKGRSLTFTRDKEHATAVIKNDLQNLSAHSNIIVDADDPNPHDSNQHDTNPHDSNQHDSNQHDSNQHNQCEQDIDIEDLD